jgi:hypothetical protein
MPGNKKVTKKCQIILSGWQNKRYNNENPMRAGAAHDYTKNMPSIGLKPIQKSAGRIPDAIKCPLLGL